MELKATVSIIIIIVCNIAQLVIFFVPETSINQRHIIQYTVFSCISLSFFASLYMMYYLYCEYFRKKHVRFLGVEQGLTQESLEQHDLSTSMLSTV